MPRPVPIQPAPGQESVWDYPRPPRLEPTTAVLKVIFNGQTIAETNRGYRLLETSHPPTYYFPPQDVQMDFLRPATRQSFCEFKGMAHYFDVVVGENTAVAVAWTYPKPPPAYQALQNHLAFYAHAMQACYVGDEKVVPQPGNFYGGWVTSNIVGPFKGGPGSTGW